MFRILPLSLSLYTPNGYITCADSVTILSKDEFLESKHALSVQHCLSASLPVSKTPKILKNSPENRKKSARKIGAMRL